MSNWYSSYPKWFWRGLSISVRLTGLAIVLAVYAIDPKF